MRNLFLFRHNPNHDYMDVILLYNIIIYKFSVYYYINGKLYLYLYLSPQTKIYRIEPRKQKK